MTLASRRTTATAAYASRPPSPTATQHSRPGPASGFAPAIEGRESTYCVEKLRLIEAPGAGHCFIVFLGEGYYPVNVLNAIKMVPEVCRIFCATANPVEVVLAETEQGRGLLGVIDGLTPKGIEGEDDIAWRKNLLRQFGYKL